ncbi:hypothetical protein Q3G72_009544 [Acer saccharum]|nr:hypothetical protein Q3G72_009544 [Acer saccharum]
MLVKALCDDTEYKLGLTIVVGASGLSRRIEHARIQKPGLALAGLVDTVHKGRIEVLGHAEMLYLLGLDQAQQTNALQALLQANIACVIITSSAPPPEPLLALAKALHIAVMSTALSCNTFVTRAHQFLDEHLSPETSVHGVLVDAFGVGVLLTGQSGIGKSECALDLIMRGHRLVADDVVVVRQQDRELIGMSSPLTKHHMEVRGLGIINVRDLFGAACASEKKRVDMVVEMLEWTREADYDRLGIDDNFETILSVAIARVRLPIRPGRNVASIVEVAARNYLLKMQGHHSAREFARQLEKNLAQPQHRAAQTP